MSLRKSSNSRNGSKSVVLPKPNARRKWTPAPSRVGLALTSRLTGRMDILPSSTKVYRAARNESNAQALDFDRFRVPPTPPAEPEPVSRAHRGHPHDRRRIARQHVARIMHPQVHPRKADQGG